MIPHFNSVSFIDYNVLPVKFFEGCLFSNDNFIRGDDNIKITCHNFILNQLGSFYPCPLQYQDFNIGYPTIKFTLPIVQCRLGCDDQMGSIDTLINLK